MANSSDEANLSFWGSQDKVSICPQDEQEDILFLGIAADEIPAGVFERTPFSFPDKVEGPGAVSLYSSDAFGNPTLFFDSSDGLGENDVFPMSVGGHAHQNWAFTRPGYYQISLQHRQPLLMEHPLPVMKPRFSLRCLLQPFRQKELDIEVAFEGTILSWLPWMKPTSERSSQVNWSWWLRMKLSKSYQRIPLTLFSAPLVYGLRPSPRRARGFLYVGIAGDEIESGLFEGSSEFAFGGR